jgi:NLI interacting factor-like phosphatase
MQCVYIYIYMLWFVEFFHLIVFFICVGRKTDEGLQLHRLNFHAGCMIVKLRPFVRDFLEEVNKMFDLYIYTMGTQTYATEVVKLLDPENEYFPSKLISRLDFTRRKQKALSSVPGYSKACTIILDDKLSVCFSYLLICLLFCTEILLVKC